MHRPRIMHNRKRLMALFLVMNLVLSPLSSYAVEEGRIETGVEGLTENREELARKEDAAVSSEKSQSSKEGEDAVSATDESKTAEELSGASAEEGSEALSADSKKRMGIPFLRKKRRISLKRESSERAWRTERKFR